MKIFWQPWGCRGCPHQKNWASLLLFDKKRPKAVVRPWLMLQKIFYGIWKVYTWVKKIWYYFISTSTNDLRTASENLSKTYGAPCICKKKLLSMLCKKQYKFKVPGFDILTFWLVWFFFLNVLCYSNYGSSFLLGKRVYFG